MANIFDCANYLIREGGKKDYPAISPLKLQKLLYYSQVYSLVCYNKRLFKNNFEAWVHGPVCPELYMEYQNIKKNEAIPIKDDEFLDSKIESFEKEILDKILFCYGSYSGEQLEYLTHREKPWIDARINLKPWEKGNNLITDEAILEYYRLA